MRETDISQKVRRRVYERDSFDGRVCCIYCGSPYNIELAHYIGRAQMGKGIEENLASLCHNCHQTMDNGQGSHIRDFVREYLSRKYKNWSERDLIAGKDKTW